MITFTQIAEAARLLSSAEGGEKQETAADVLIMRFTAPTIREAMANAMRPLQGYAVPVPFRVYGIRPFDAPAVVDVELRLDVGTQPEGG
jgi:hypothetical protein